MPLKKISLKQFRCFNQQILNCHPRVNIIVGPNASGKTSLLEAIYVLGHGKSFRTHRIEPLITANQKFYQVVGQTISGNTIGVQRDKKAQLAKIDGIAVNTQAELSAYLPVQIIHPRIANLITEGPSTRRRYLDWGVFHVKQHFLNEWRKFNLCLSQRNAALKKNGSAEIIASFDAGLIESGENISYLRQEFYEQLLLPQIMQQITHLLPNAELTLSYWQGWQGDYAEKLKSSLARDLQFKTTHHGPHKADINIQLNGSPAGLALSSGQQKILAIALVLAQIEVVTAIQNKPITVLVDDLAAELDKEKLELVLSKLLQLDGQLWITSLEDHRWMGKPDDYHMFHVKQGVVEW